MYRFKRLVSVGKSSFHFGRPPLRLRISREYCTSTGMGSSKLNQGPELDRNDDDEHAESRSVAANDAWRAFRELGVLTDECVVVKKSCPELFVFRPCHNREWCLGWRAFRRVSVKVVEKNSDLGRIVCDAYRRVINLEEFHGIPEIFDILEDDRSWFFVTQVLECTLLDLVYLKHPRFYCSRERRDIPVGELMKTTKFWDEENCPLSPSYLLVKDILLAVLHLNSHGLFHHNFKLDNMLVYVVENKLRGRIWPLEDKLQVGFGLREQCVLNALGSAFFEFLTGGVAYPLQGDLTMIATFPDALHFIEMLIDSEAHVMLNKIVQHPFMWDEGLHMEFITSISNCFKSKVPRDDSVEHMLEQMDCDVLKGGSWGEFLPQRTQDILKRREYDFHRIKDLVRLMRNMRCHPEDVFLRGISDVTGERLYVAVRKKFPNFLSELYNFATDASIPQEFSSFIKREIKGHQGQS